MYRYLVTLRQTRIEGNILAKVIDALDGWFQTVQAEFTLLGFAQETDETSILIENGKPLDDQDFDMILAKLRAVPEFGHVEIQQV